MKIIDFYGNEIWSDAKEIEVLENSSQEFYHFPLDKIDKKSTVLIAKFDDKTSYFYFAKPKELKLPKSDIQQKIVKTDKRFSITIKSNVLLKDVFLFTEEKGHFSDNFFDVLPNQTKTVFFETKTTKLNDLKIKTLNEINGSY